MENVENVAEKTKMLTGKNGRMQISYNGKQVWCDYFPDLNSWMSYHDGSVFFFTCSPMTAEEIEKRFTHV